MLFLTSLGSTRSQRDWLVTNCKHIIYSYFIPGRSINHNIQKRFSTTCNVDPLLCVVHCKNIAYKTGECREGKCYCFHE